MWNEFIPDLRDLTQGASFRARLCHQPKVVYRPAWSRRWWASLSVRGERATTGLRRALSEAGEGTVLARPEAQLSGRARAVVPVANDEAKRPSGSPPRHLSMPSMNSTPRVRPVRSSGGFGRGAQRGCWSAPFWGSPVPCRRSRSRPRLLGGSFGAFSVDFGRAALRLFGRGVFLGGAGGLGRVVEKRKCRVSI